MSHTQVIVPAAAVLPGNALALALGLHHTVEISLRTDDQHIFAVHGADATLVSQCMMQAFHAYWNDFKGLTRSLPGLNILAQTQIPPAGGVGDQSSWVVAGLVGINSLLGGPLPREKLAALAVACAPTIVAQQAAIAALYGGLTTTFLAGATTLSRRLDVTSIKVIIGVPTGVDGSALPPPMIAVAASQASQSVLLAEALRVGDLDLLGEVLADHSSMGSDVLSFHAATEVALQAGAAAMVRCGDGGGFIVFANNHHERIETRLRQSFAAAGVRLATWITAVDTQGVAINRVN
jgi:homoserine kinase